MADYSHVNLTEIDDQAPNLGLDPSQFNLRFGRVPLGCEHCGVSHLRFAPGAKSHGHRHKRQEEIYVLVSGAARMKIEDEVKDLEQWDAVRVDKDTMRSIEAGDEGAEFLIVGAPNTGPGDAEVVQGWWSD